MPPSPSPRPSTGCRGVDLLCDYAIEQGYDLRIASSQANEPRGDILLPTVGQPSPSF